MIDARHVMIFPTCSSLSFSLSKSDVVISACGVDDSVQQVTALQFKGAPD